MPGTVCTRLTEDQASPKLQDGCGSGSRNPIPGETLLALMTAGGGRVRFLQGCGYREVAYALVDGPKTMHRLQQIDSEVFVCLYVLKTGCTNLEGEVMMEMGRNGRGGNEGGLDQTYQIYERMPEIGRVAFQNGKEPARTA